MGLMVTVLLENLTLGRMGAAVTETGTTCRIAQPSASTVSFSDAFPCVTEAPTYGQIKQLRLFIDRCSIEAFDADGKMAMTNLVFPSEPYNMIKVKGGKATIYEVKSEE